VKLPQATLDQARAAVQTIHPVPPEPTK